MGGQRWGEMVTVRCTFGMLILRCTLRRVVWVVSRNTSRMLSIRTHTFYILYTPTHHFFYFIAAFSFLGLSSSQMVHLFSASNMAWAPEMVVVK